MNEVQVSLVQKQILYKPSLSNLQKSMCMVQHDKKLNTFKFQQESQGISCFIALLKFYQKFQLNQMKIINAAQEDSSRYNIKNNNDKTNKKELLRQGCGLLAHPLNEASIVKAPPRHIRVKFFQGIGESSILSILKKSITIHSLGINFIHTICINNSKSTPNSSDLKRLRRKSSSTNNHQISMK